MTKPRPSYARVTSEPHPGDDLDGSQRLKGVLDTFKGALSEIGQRTAIIGELMRERNNQLKRWSTEHDDQHTNHDWVAFVTHYLGRAAAWPFDAAAYRSSMIKIAALAVAAVESYDRTQRAILAQTPLDPTDQATPEPASAVDDPQGSPPLTREDIKQLMAEERQAVLDELLRMLGPVKKVPGYDDVVITPFGSATSTAQGIQPGPTGTAGGNWPAPGVYEDRLASVPADIMEAPPAPVQVRYTEVPHTPRHVPLASQAGVGDTYDYDDL